MMKFTSPQADTAAQTVIDTKRATDRTDRSNTEKLLEAYGELAAPLTEKQRKVVRKDVYARFVKLEEMLDAASESTKKFKPSMSAESFRDNIARPAVAIVDMVGLLDGEVQPGLAIAEIEAMMKSEQIPADKWNLKKVANAIAVANGLKVPKGNDDDTAEATAEATAEETAEPTAEETAARLLDVTLANLAHLTEEGLSAVAGAALARLDARNTPIEALDISKIYETV